MVNEIMISDIRLPSPTIQQFPNHHYSTSKWLTSEKSYITSNRVLECLIQALAVQFQINRYRKISVCRKERGF